MADVVRSSGSHHLGSCVDGSGSDSMADTCGRFDGLDIGGSGESPSCWETTTMSGDGKTGGNSNNKLFGKFTEPASIVPPASLPELISRLHEVFAEDEICVEYVQRLMASYKSTPSEWKKFAKFDKYKYTRNLVDEGNGKFNLMILCWNESQGSSIHSHADSHCFLKVLNGEVKEELYHWPEESVTSSESREDTNGGRNHDNQCDDSSMRKKAEMRFDTNECTYINDSIGLHRVENESHFNKAVTLHLYSPPFQECSCFDQRSGRVTTAKMTFWSKFGKRTPYGKNPEKIEQPVEDN